ncbi:RNA polymerase sigma-70 factor, sigma-E family [Thermomonospora echinospora]|uniref:RNA polymerase sigma-70 factor, sigma-E family n=1 Tax=Thermomonospora echinospora TaxID=1992 RepID=A0A1H5XC59_9ACTN|nr:SigE family RNA polymerase sigma factor [Thermomonospora echinospora]SEG09338.1 RNA polymerase sigma-70 factor, sigma-E family [Thermomonospora echinospora]
MNDDADFTRFVQDRGPELLRLAVALTGDRDQAEDVVQGALERLYGRWGRVRRRGDPEWYVRRSIVNAVRDGWRGRRRHPEVLGLAAEEHSDQVAYAPIDEVLTRDAVRGALACLPPRQRMVITLRYWGGCTEAETARLMGISVGTVKSQAHRALKELRGRLHTTEIAQGARR